MENRRTKERGEQMKKKVKSWAIVVEWEHEDGTWNTETITDVDSMTANAVDEFLTEYENYYEPLPQKIVDDSNDDSNKEKMLQKIADRNGF